jgi:hypothetical protein
MSTVTELEAKDQELGIEVAQASQALFNAREAAEQHTDSEDNQALALALADVMILEKKIARKQAEQAELADELAEERRNEWANTVSPALKENQASTDSAVEAFSIAVATLISAALAEDDKLNAVAHEAGTLGFNDRVRNTQPTPLYGTASYSGFQVDGIAIKSRAATTAARCSEILSPLYAALRIPVISSDLRDHGKYGALLSSN